VIWSVSLGEFMSYFKVFKMPVPMKITGRSSSITNAFVNSIIPIMHPSENDIKDSLKLLGMTVETIECIYCGSKYTEWDHLRPLVLNKGGASGTGIDILIDMIKITCYLLLHAKKSQN